MREKENSDPEVADQCTYGRCSSVIALLADVELKLSNSMIQTTAKTCMVEKCLLLKSCVNF